MSGPGDLTAELFSSTVFALQAPAPGGAAHSKSEAFAVALEAVRKLAVAALGVHDGVAFNRELFLQSGLRKCWGRTRCFK